MFDFACKQQARDLHERDLNGVGVFEDGQVDGNWRATAASLIGVQLDAVLQPLVMEEAVASVLECGRAAQGSVDLDVLTTSHVGGIVFVGITHE